MKVCVEIYPSVTAYEDGADPITTYVMDHDDDRERRLLGQQCRHAFEANQMVVTYPLPPAAGAAARPATPSPHSTDESRPHPSAGATSTAG